jgi:peroxiredoxin
MHVVVFGVSPHDASAHKAWIAEQKLPFDLSADDDGRIARAFNVPTRGDYMYTFLVDRDGKTIRRAWQTANPEAHAQEILALAAQ